jgi:hypothetical protein
MIRARRPYAMRCTARATAYRDKSGLEPRAMTLPVTSRSEVHIEPFFDSNRDSNAGEL